MKHRIFSLLILLFLITSACFAQLEKANRYYDGYQFNSAIKYYLKVLKKGDNAEALQKIANSYRLVRNYEQAEIYYSRLMKTENTCPKDHYYYGMMLKNNNKIDEARTQFSYYYNANPSDKQAATQVKSCDDIKLWIRKTAQYDVSNVESVNTPHSEFGLVVMKNKVVFTSDRSKEVLEPNTDSWSKKPFLNVFEADIKGTKDGLLQISDKAKAMDYPINSQYHDGPICFNAEENTMYLTRVNYVEKKKDKSFVNRPKLFISKAKGDKWGSLEEFPYNSDLYSIAHPSISADGNSLFFASDMLGGYGGTDIYVCHREGDSWGKPQNVGAEVNTPADEVFPYIAKDGTLYFSSDGHSGFGGLDVFSANYTNNVYTDVSNLGMPLNSYTDDFAIVFIDDTHGYFSSDRTNGKGDDDIYSFIALNLFTTISGNMLLSRDINDPFKNAVIKVYTEDGTLIKTSSTDSMGYFKFNKLDSDKKYLVKVDENNPQLTNLDRIYMADKEGKIIGITIVNREGEKFVFHHLPMDKKELDSIPEGNDVNFAGNLFYGSNPSMPLENTKVNLVNSKGEIVGTARTNGKGAFVFRHLPTDANFLVQVDESDTDLKPNTVITITNKDGKKIQTTKVGNKGQFNFTFLSSDKATLKEMKAEDSELRFDFKGGLSGGNKNPLANSVVNIVNEKGEIIMSCKTDSKGNFIFTNLPTEKSILFSLDENDEKLKGFDKLYLMDEKGNIIKELTRNKSGKFNFTLLPSEIKKISSMYADDTGLATLNRTKRNERNNSDNKSIESKKFGNADTLTITERIYYNLDDYKIQPEALPTLNKIILLMNKNPNLLIEFSSHTDSRASESYNLNLSQQRANKIKEFFLNAGISKERISGIGYGETRLVNKCADGVECTEEEHAKNRRTEFKMYQK